VTGNKTYIPNDVQESLRKTGLAHILAISGLHMALVTLTVIWCIRLVLAFLGHCNTTCLGHDFSYAACGVNG